MDTDETKNLYEVTELQEYDTSRGSFPSQPIKLHVQQPPASKISITAIVGVIVVIMFILIILVVVTIVTLTQLNALQVCENSNGPSGVTAGGGLEVGGDGCAACNLSHGIVQQIETILNVTRETSNKVENYTLTNKASSDNFSSLVTQLLQDTAWKVDDIRSSTNEQIFFLQNVTSTLFQVLQTTEDSAAKLINIVSTLSNMQDTGSSTAGVVDDSAEVIHTFTATHSR